MDADNSGREDSRMANLSALYHRTHRLLDLPGLYRLHRFQGLRKAFYRELWEQAARSVGADFQDWDFGYFRISRGGSTTMVKLGSVMMDNHLMLDLMGNKPLTYALLGEKGHAVPEFRVYSMQSLHKAEAFLELHGGPVVVKPATGSGGGRGVTTGIGNRRALRKASRLAARYDGTLLVEEQIDGQSYRLLYLDSEFIDAVRRDPPTLTGDGRHSIRDLVRMENRSRLSGRPFSALSPLQIDQDCHHRLRALGLSPRSRLAAGNTIVLKRAVNENSADGNHSVRHQVHPETIARGARLVQDLGVRFAGLDVICQDIAAPLSPDNGRINEINTTPGIHHHYLIAQPAGGVRVAEILLSRLFESGRGVMRLGDRAAHVRSRAA